MDSSLYWVAACNLLLVILAVSRLDLQPLPSEGQRLFLSLRSWQALHPSPTDSAGRQPAHARPGTFVGQVDWVQLHWAAMLVAGLPSDWLDRASLVEQPYLSPQAVTRFAQRCKDMEGIGFPTVQQGSGLHLSRFNISGQGWLLLAFPGGTVEDARSIFTERTAGTESEQPGDDLQLRIELAGPAYTGAAVLAQCLLGCPQSEVAFRREAAIHVDPSEWSFGFFKTRSQLLPTFLLLLEGDAALLSRSAAASLRQRNSYLESRENVRRGLLDRTRKNAALETRNAKGAARKRRNYVATDKDTLRGHARVEIAEIAQPTSTSLTMNLD